MFLVGVGIVHTQVVRARAVADLAALSGGDVSAVAEWAAVGDGPCHRARMVTEANGVELVSCSVSETDTRVVVQSHAKVMGISFPVQARARAGPVDP